MEVIKENKYVVVGTWWRVEEVTNRVVKKVSLWLDPSLGYILSANNLLSLTFDLVLLMENFVFLTSWTVYLSVLYVDQMFLFVDMDSGYEEFLFDMMDDIFMSN